MSEKKMRELGRFFLENYAQIIENAADDMSEIERYKDDYGVYPTEKHIWYIYKNLTRLTYIADRLQKHLEETEDNA